MLIATTTTKRLQLPSYIGTQNYLRKGCHKSTVCAITSQEERTDVFKTEKGESRLK